MQHHERENKHLKEKCCFTACMENSIMGHVHATREREGQTELNICVNASNCFIFKQ